MDKLFYESVVARERKDEISKELAIRHMLKEAERDNPGTSKPKRVILRITPALILITLILLYFLG
jgi:hypothetical protein